MKKEIRLLSLIAIIASVLLLQGCDIRYASRIKIKETFSNSVNSDVVKNDTLIKATFADFCSKANYSPQSNEMLFLEKNTEVISACGLAWFHSARLWKKNALYEIELWLQQPGTLLGKRRVAPFCSETKEMADYFRTKFGASNISVIPDSTCK